MSTHTVWRSDALWRAIEEARHQLAVLRTQHYFCPEDYIRLSRFLSSHGEFRP